MSSRALASSFFILMHSNFHMALGIFRSLDTWYILTSKFQGGCMSSRALATSFFHTVQFPFL